MTKQAKGRIRLIAVVFLLLGFGLLGANQARAAITDVGEVLPVYDGVSDPWIITENFWVGIDADGGLTVSGGSAVTNPYAVLGVFDGVTGSATITGPGSSWLTSGFLVAGYEGIGNLLIEAGGLVGSDIGILGEEATGEGNALVTGAGSTWTIDDYLTVAHEGQAAMSIEDGGLVEAPEVYIGNLAGSDGIIYVMDADSLLSATESIFVGYDGQGEMEVTDGGQVSSFYGGIGYDIGSDGTVTVSGLDSLWDNEGSLGVGVFGDGTLTITNSGTVESQEAGVAVGPDSVATVEVSNGGTWNNTGALAIGILGDGTMTIEAGGQVMNTDAYLGGMDPEAPNVDVSPFLGDDPLDGTGTVFVTGAGSRWDSSGDLYVGYSGTGELEVSHAGVVTSESGMLGFEVEGDGTVTVTNLGSEWDVNDVLTVGGAGEGTLVVSDRGLVTAGDVQIGGYIPEEGFETLADFLDPDAVLPEGTGTITVITEAILESDGLSVGFWGDGTLDVNDGGQVVSAWAELGVGPNAVGTATVRGATSTWTIDDELTVGVYGQGDLTIAGGGQVSAYDVYVGGAPLELMTDEGYDPDLLPNGTGTVTVTGADSRLTVAAEESLYVGYFGDGTLDVNDGGQVESAMVVVGAGPDAVGTVRVEDAGSLLSAEELLVGFWGQGDVTVAGGAQTLVGQVVIGGGQMPDNMDPDMLADFGDPMGVGTVTVTGAGSRLDVDDFLYVGYTGTGTLDVNDGGVVTSDYGAVGADPGSTGTVTVSGTDSRWWIDEDLAVGAFGEGDLTVAAGGRVDAVDIYVGGFDTDAMGDPDMNDIPQGIGTIAVTGAGSRLDADNFLFVGYTGDGTLDVNEGGRVTSYYGAVGADAGSTGTATVTGAGSEWLVSEALVVGAFGQGDLTISDGGGVYATEVYIGGFDTDILDEEIEETPEGTGTVTVTGEDSYLQAGGPLTLYVGYSGDGTLDILEGGTVLSQTSYIGYEEGSTGTVTVSDPNSSWTATGSLHVGYGGTGSLNVSGGGLVDSGQSYLATDVGAVGEVIVEGADSTWLATSIAVGQEGEGRLVIRDGGEVTVDDWVIVGRHAGSVGEVTVTGADSLWEIGGSLRVGWLGEGELIVSEGGQVWSGAGVPDAGYIGGVPDGIGSVTVTGEGSEWIEEGNVYVGYDGTGSLTVSDGGYVRSGEDLFIAYSREIFGDEASEGLVTVTGDDSLLRVFESIYVGGSSTQAAGTGVLAVNDGGRVIADEVTIWETGTLTGDGTVSVMVPTTVHNYGTIAPGDDGIGTLTVEGDVVFHEGSTFDVQIGGTEADKLAVDGDVTIHEYTTVQVRSVGTVVGTQEYEIIEADSVTGTFDVLDTALLTLYFNEIGLEYEPGSVWLWIDAMRFDDPNIVRTYNQRQVAGGLQEIADEGGNAITADLQMVETNEELLDNYDQLAGRSRPSLAPIAAAGTGRFLGSVSSRLRNPSAVVASGNWTGSQLSGSAGPDGALGSRTSYDINMGGYNFAVGNGSPYLSDSPWGVWAKGYGLFGNRDHSLEAPGYDYRTYGVSMGLDYQFTETLLIGLTGGYADTHVNYDRSRDNSDLRAMHFGFYGSWSLGSGYLDSLLTYSDLDYDTQRYVDLTGERLEGEFGGYAVSGYFETGFDWRHVAGWLVQPLASFQFSYLGLDSYRESGGDAALGFKRQNFESYIGSLGAKVSKDLLRDSATSRLAVQFRARWLHEFGDTRSDVNTYFASDPTVVFNIRNERIDRDSAVLGLGLGAELNRRTRLYVDYDTRLNADDTAHLISAGLQHRW
ncbi:autotransporter domain-containing protein [Anaerobaca lacustris]|uniref:Autotransporter domain-containing protein n=1 Tax=Anaerobaca lacustris TaxID=3044600 RepID=A0AAW6TZZ7_9BACT|nr:autotransporter domain-containing protein [Sedimentisphaerales bacterium M17dextr]